MTFEELHEVARNQDEAASRGKLDLQTGSDAIVVARELFDWIAENVDEAGREEVAEIVVRALNLETFGERV